MPIVELKAPDIEPHRYSATGVDYIHSFESAKPGPHVMVVGMAGMLEDLPKSPDNPKKPVIMWSGTSYEHIMMPVK